MNYSQTQFWSVPSFEFLQQLQTTPQGLRSDEIQEWLLRYRSNRLKPKKKSDGLTLLIARFKSPIILILMFAAGLSFFRSEGAILAIHPSSSERGILAFSRKPGKYLLTATLLSVTVTILLPITPLAELLGFQPLPMRTLLVIGIIVALYMIAAEITKRFFYKGWIFEAGFSRDKVKV